MSEEGTAAARPSPIGDPIAWRREEFTYASPDEFERSRGEKWVAPGTRNHTTWQRGAQHGIAREVRQTGEWWSVEDEHKAALTPLLRGRTIVSVEREPSSDYEWSHDENDVTITLDDGSRLCFSGWGYDASGVNTSYSPPRENALPTER